MHIDTPFGGRSLSSGAELQRYRELINITERAALGTEESRQFIHRIARDLRKTAEIAQRSIDRNPPPPGPTERTA
ncbi:hypothetical protein [Streptomyces sp. NPDC002537]